MATTDYLEWTQMKDLVHEIRKAEKHTDIRMALLVHLGSHVALRINDLLGLTWRHILNDQGVGDHIVLVEKKTGKKRYIALHKDVKKHLWDYYKKYATDPASYIFANHRGDKAISDSFADRELKRLKVEHNLKIGNIATHTLRKTWARRVWEKSGRDSGTLELISMALNHSSISITRKYLGVTKKEISNLYLSV